MSRHCVAVTTLSVVVTLCIAGCGAVATNRPASTPAASTQTTDSFDAIPPTINEGTLVPGPVSILRPGAPIRVGDDVTDDSRLCLTGFSIDYPQPNGNRRPGFVTAAQCAHGDAHAAVFVTKTLRPSWQQIKVGEITILDCGDGQPTSTDHPWTIQTSPLAVFGAGPGSWVLPVDSRVNGASPSSGIVGAAKLAWRAPARWIDSFGHVTTGHVLDPATTPALADLPAGIERVVIAADDPDDAIYPWVRGSPVTAELGGVTKNLGIVTGVAPERHWIVVDLIGPFLAAHGARLLTP